jgi:Sec-independent protein secretion pathway component TatC
MSSDLSPESEQFIQQVVAAGLFPDRGRALDEAVGLLKRRQELLAHRRTAVLHVLVVFLIGYFVASTLGALLAPSPDPFSMLRYGIPVFAVLEASYWTGYGRGLRRRMQSGER